ncbi:Meiotic recombination protein rec8 [Purpureocillium lavendulum]|uniref:Meiotic recombination protein rec8 n=1 Tax=Purpureocillium lavendulum TaxID=1247861 RepID=A0AB34G7V9_9HYPO|nr:Meiotic recombination protein rec8 [Purpureocillium lavendulum]
MSLTSKERGNPPPRSKSCVACRRAKRRCDFALPSCLRCEQRGIQCDYPTRACGPGPSSGSRQRRTLHTTVPIEENRGWDPQVDHGGDDDDYGLAAAAAAAAPPRTPPLDALDCMNLDIGTLDPVTASAPTTVSTCTSTPANYSYPCAAGLGDFADVSLLGFSTDASAMDMDVVHQPSALSAPTAQEFQHIEEAISQRLRFAIEEIRNTPGMMIAETQTPWCHPLLYRDGMPRSIQGRNYSYSLAHAPPAEDSTNGPAHANITRYIRVDAHAACALYAAKTRVNAPIIFHAIEVRACDLLATPAPTRFLDVLARTQALILYQIIRLFDGDMRARSSAEKAIPALESATMDLLAHVRFDAVDEAPAREELPLHPLAPTQAFWRDWILQESARRTCLFAFFFLQVYRLLAGQRGLTCDGRLGLCHAWTLSAHLWTAPSAVEFARAWGARRHFVVRDAQFASVLDEAKADDVDRFGRMWISCLLGVDEAEGWFASRGGSLRMLEVC